MTAVAHLAPTSRLTMAEQTLRILATHRPNADWGGQRRLLRTLRREVFETPKQRKDGRIVSSDELLEAGLRYADQAGAAEQPATLANAKRRRDGTMVALLAVMPLRRRNFCVLQLGRSLVVGANGMQVRLDDAETKPTLPHSSSG